MTSKKPEIPKHIAIIMDGNGRWAKQKHLPRSAGHRAGVETAKKIIRSCAERGVQVLTLFAFSSENWQRPSGEVTDLMGLFLKALQQDIKELHENNVQFHVIGDYNRLSERLRKGILEAEQLTQNNTGIQLIVAIDYGGRWDILQAIHALNKDIQNKKMTLSEVDETIFSHYLSTAKLPDPDLFIRTGGEFRISNFLLWQLAYSELYFTPVFWPDFNESILENALDFFATRERRFGTLEKK